MCCFSGPVERVESTRIFARMTAPGRQALVYQMKVAAEAEVAMVLPLPVPPGAGEDAVRWVALDGYPDFFADVAKAFPAPVAVGAFGRPGYGPPAALAVVTVGDFVASFVPSLRDFARLDQRFRMQPGTIDSVPHYADWVAAEPRWARSPGPLGQSVDVARSRGLIDGDAPVSATSIRGLYANQDIWLQAA